MRGTRIAAAIVAALLATAGVVMVMMYVQGADERAAAELQPTDVLVVTKEIPAGTAAQIGTNIELQQLPSRAVVDGALDEVNTLDGRVANSTLYPGEQIIPARFAAPEVLTGDAVPIPPDSVQVTVSLAPERVIGGKLKPGDTVGLVISAGEPIPYSQTIMHGVLVARVQAIAPPPQEDGQDVPPSDSHFVTFAVSAPDAERIVWAAEHTSIWLTLEREESDVSGTTIVTRLNVGPTPLPEGDATLAGPAEPEGDGS